LQEEVKILSRLNNKLNKLRNVDKPIELTTTEIKKDLEIESIQKKLQDDIDDTNSIINELNTNNDLELNKIIKLLEKKNRL